MSYTRSKKILSRKRGPRVALLNSLSQSLIRQKSIFTTEVKAKVLSSYVSKLITKARKALQRKAAMPYASVAGALKKDTTQILFEEVLPKLRQSGYTRVVKLPPRQGDAAPMALIELVDFALVSEGQTKDKPKTRRSRKKTESASATPAKAKATQEGTTSETTA